MNRLVLASSLLVLAGLSSPPVLAQSAQINRGATSSDLASNMADLRQQNAQMSLDMTRMQDEVASLNGRVETLEFLLSQSREEVNRMQGDDSRIGQELERLNEQNSELVSRINQLESQLETLSAAVASGETGAGPATSASEAASAETSEASGTSSGQPRRVGSLPEDTDLAGDGSNPGYQGSLGTIEASNLPGEAGPLFATAKSRLLKFDYEGAETAFRAFLQKFGDDPQAGEAQYWLAETLFQQEAYAESGQAYTAMIREYPDNARAPDALVKLARSMRLLGDTEKACNALAILPEQYPDASGVTKNLAALERTRAGCSS